MTQPHMTAREKRDIGVFIVAFLCFCAFWYTFLVGRGEVAPVSLQPVKQSFAVAVPFTEIARGLGSRVGERVNYVITSSDDFTKLWKMIGATSTPPMVDFKTHTVLAVFAGLTNTPQANIRVTKILDSIERDVLITVTIPDVTCKTTCPVVTPYQLVEVPATRLPLTHEDIVVHLEASRGSHLPLKPTPN